MSGVSVSIDLGGVLEAGKMITKDDLPRVREAVGMIAAQGQRDWQDAVSKAPGIWSVEKNAYIQSIKWEYTGDFSARVWSEYKFADEIETGRPARDLKKMLDTSMKVRTVKSGQNTGKRYLIIPMQHNVPGSSALAPSMPTDVHAAALQLAPSMVTGMGRRESGTGAWDTRTRAPATVPQRKYQWGGRLDAMNMQGLSRQEQRIYDGMYRFDTTGKGGKPRSTYLTFRVMMEGSAGWIVPAQPGRHFIPDVVGRLQPLAEQVIQKAVQLDISGMG